MMNTQQVISEIANAGKMLTKATPEQRQMALALVAAMTRNAMEYPILFARLNRLYPSCSIEAMASIDAIVSQPMDADAAARAWALLDGDDQE